MSRNFERGLLLYQQRNYAAAEKELKLAVSEDPEDTYARALLAGCMQLTGRLNEGLEEVERAISIDPTDPFPYYMRSCIQLERGNFQESLKSVQEAVRIDPYNEFYFAQLSEVYFFMDKFPESLEAADTGLSLDPENTGSVNARARVLVKLGRDEEAEDSLSSALEREPDNSYTHTNLGWVKLRRGASTEALEHFKEGLRLDPNSEWAREGVVEAIKGRSPFYYPILKLSMWLADLDSRVRVALVLMLLLLPTMRLPILVVLLLVWFSDQLFNTLLRLDPYGRIVLTDEQRQSSNFFAGASVMVMALALFVFINPSLKEKQLTPPGISQRIEVTVAAYSKSSGENSRQSRRFNSRLERLFARVDSLAKEKNSFAEQSMLELVDRMKGKGIEGQPLNRARLKLAYYLIRAGKFERSQQIMNEINPEDFEGVDIADSVPEKVDEKVSKERLSGKYYQIGLYVLKGFVFQESGDLKKAEIEFNKANQIASEISSLSEKEPESSKATLSIGDLDSLVKWRGEIK